MANENKRLVKKEEIPASLPANGGNADTVGGKYPGDFVASTGGFIDGLITVGGKIEGTLGVGNSGKNYGAIVAVRPNTDNLCYYSLLRSGSLAKGLGLNSNNRLIFGTPNTSGDLQPDGIVAYTSEIPSLSGYATESWVNSRLSVETASTIMSKINSQGEIIFTKHVVCVNGAGTASTSDMRFKKNVQKLPDLLPAVVDAPLFNYTWKEDVDMLVGSSAQYWEEYLPELVYEMEDGTKTLSYERLGGVVALKALQEEYAQRMKENDELRNRCIELEKRLEVLEKMVTGLVK